MRPALYYALTAPTPEEFVKGADRWQIVAITSENGDKWYGRHVVNRTSTHGFIRDLHGRYETDDDAQLAIQRIERIKKHHAPMINAIEQRLVDAHRTLQRSIVSALGE